MSLIPVRVALFAGLLVLLSGPACVGAEPASPAQILAGVSRAAVLRAEFTQTKTIAALTRPLVTSGRFVFVRGQGLLWRIEQPYRVTYLLADRGIVEVDENGNAIRGGGGQATGLQHVSRIFRALFEPDIELLDQYFTPVASGDARHWELQLAPRQASLRQVFKTVRVAGARFVEQVVLDETSGDTTTIRFQRTEEATAPDEHEQRLLRPQ